MKHSPYYTSKQETCLYDDQNIQNYVKNVLSYKFVNREESGRNPIIVITDEKKKHEKKKTGQ